MKRIVRFAAAGFAAMMCALSAAQEYPQRPIKIIVPFSPGGAVDGPTRALAQQLSKQLGQQVIVENKPGAGATIGSDMVAKALPDGYTLLLASQTNAISATLYSKLPFDPIEDFAPISLLGREPGVLVVHPSFPAKTAQEFVAYVKTQPGKIDYASSGNGSGQHLFMAMLGTMSGLTMNHIPYRGSGQATTDLVGGQVLVSMPGMAGMLGHIKAGKLRALAVSSDKRSPQLPDVPTLAETIAPGFSAYVWMGLLAPKGMPSAIIDKLQRESVIALASPDVKNYMQNGSLEIVGSTPAEFASFFRAERDRWAKVVRETNAKID
jgi:tripartite-type tricarboxylate transporter receptor subunit TctC